MVERTRKLRRDLVIIGSFYETVFGTDQGKKVLEDLEVSFDGSCYQRGDPYHTAFLEGQREVLLRIKQLISYAGCEIEEEVKEDA